jgi:MFS family permease
MKYLIISLLVVIVLLLLVVIIRYRTSSKVKWIWDWHTIIIGSLLAGFVLCFFAIYHWLTGLIVANNGTHSATSVNDWNWRTFALVAIILLVSGLLILFVLYLKKKIKDDKADEEEKNRTSADSDKKDKKEVKVEKVTVEKKSWVFYFLMILLVIIALHAVGYIMFWVGVYLQCSLQRGGSTNSQIHCTPDQIMVINEECCQPMAVENNSNVLGVDIIEPVDAKIWFIDRKGKEWSYELGQRKFFDRDAGWVKIRSQQGEVKIKYWYQKQ